jgi:uncharacterized protein YndB with AHSA1/START domain
MSRSNLSSTVETVLIVAGSALAFGEPARAADRVLRSELLIPAPVGEVWTAWTTDRGIATFFAPEGHVDLRVDGTYDVWFNPEGTPGERGAEGMRILDVDPERRFAFTWNAPPSIPAIRGRRTVVVIDLAPADETSTRMRFTHLGWGEGPDWDKAYDYFDRAWGSYVLPHLMHRFRAGPIDWKNPPARVTSWATLKQTLVAEGSSRP